MRKKIQSIIICLILIFAIFTTIDMVFEFPLTSGSTIIYVPTDYPTIQDAINAAKDGDTVFVYSGIYYEHVVVNKSINLTGENKDSTIIDGSWGGDVVSIIANHTIISNFSIRKSSPNYRMDVGIQLNNVENCTIYNNILYQNNGGCIYIDTSSNISISHNNLNNSGDGLFVYMSSYNNITNNCMSNITGNGMHIWTSSNNNIKNNEVLNNTYGITLRKSSNNNNITNNIALNNNEHGIFLGFSSLNNMVTNNNAFNSIIGIWVWDKSDNNDIFYNNCSYNDYGMKVDGSTSNIVRNNNISSNNIFGVVLGGASYCNISNNYFVNNGVVIEGTQLIHFNTHFIPDNNIINKKPLHYFKNSSGLIIDNIECGQLIFANCTYIDIKNMQINNTDIGIQSAYSTNLNMSNNVISDTY